MCLFFLTITKSFFDITDVVLSKNRHSNEIKYCQIFYDAFVSVVMYGFEIEKKITMHFKKKISQFTNHDSIGILAFMGKA